MATLASLLRAARRRWPIAEVVGHEHVAPGRKHDPGAGFDWCALRRALRGSGLVVAPLRGAHHNRGLFGYTLPLVPCGGRQPQI
jgi:N-acetyl-anhydromuramyl-L-alanine amidase AmpD